MATKKILDYADLTAVNDAEQKKQASNAAVENYGDFQYGRANQSNATIDALLNMKPFEYDFNTDAMYQMYKDQYAAMGKQAMEDTIGKAAAMTGGYGNSYAATAGNQAYQSYLQKANEMIPQLYSMALDRYNAEQSLLNNQLSVLQADEANQYDRWQNGLNLLLTNRDYYTGEANNAMNLALQLAQSNYGIEQDDRAFNYQKERDAVTDSQWDQQFNYNKSQNSQSAYIKQLERENAQYEADNKVDYSLIKDLNADMISKTDFENYASNVTATAGGKRKVLSYRVDGKNFGSYQDYVKYYLQKRYDNGDINYGTLNEMLDQYGI